MEWDGLWVQAHHDVYLPSDDTFLLACAVEQAVRPGDRFLDVGCGTGLVSLVAARAGARVVACDLNPHAVALAAHNAKENGLDHRIDSVRADLLAGLRGPFGIIAFNPPYLPTAEEDHVEGLLDLAFDGGPDGNRVVLRFADQVAGLAKRPREILVVHSSLSDPAPLEAALGRLEYRAEVALEENHFYEVLTVRRFVLSR